MPTFAHIVNPVAAGPESDLRVAQPVTFETMRVARRTAEPGVRVRLLTTQFPEDHACVPQDFENAGDLQRSVLDVGTFARRRKLPLIADIVAQAARHAPEADYYIYTNVDIALMPYFYVAVHDLVRAGHDGIIINRRTITDRYQRVEDLALMYAEVGARHPGHDCFVFSARAARQFELGAVCVGVSLVGRIMLLNVAATASSFSLLADAHLTFHIGDVKAWRSPDLRDYEDHNRREAGAACRKLIEKGVLDPAHPRVAEYMGVIPGFEQAPPSRWQSTLQRWQRSVRKRLGHGRTE